MIEPIYQLLFGRQLLGLPKDQILVSYKTYEIDSRSDMEEINEQELTPGKTSNIQ